MPFNKNQLDLSQILQHLVKEGIIHEENLRLRQKLNQHNLEGSTKQAKISLHPFVYIVERNWKNQKTGTPITMDTLMQWLSKKSGNPLYKLDPLQIDVNAITRVMTYSYARNFNILAVEVSPTLITIATSDPWHTSWVNEIARINQKKIKLVLLDPLQITRYINEFYHVANSVISAGLDKSRQHNIKPQNFEQLLELGNKGELDSNDHHVISIVDWLLKYAFSQRASDIHFEPRRDQGYIRFRIDGKLQQVYNIPAMVMMAVSSRIKILARMNVAEKRLPQDGRIKTRDNDNNEVELRLSTMPTAFGEKLVIRIFDPKLLQLDFHQLGFSVTHNHLWQQLIQHQHGLVLVTGPTGSGKTSTLYASLKQLAKPEVNVCTIEDPIEMIEPVFNQMQVQEQIDLSFSNGIKTLLRQDPDIIMIGEIRDVDTAQMAIQAALTGHLVLSSLHTNDTASAVIRLIDLGIPAYLVENSLLGVMAQRLVRVLCPHCKQAVSISRQQWQAFCGEHLLPVPEKIYQPGACEQCRFTGYSGRIGVFEIMNCSSEIKTLIHHNANPRQIRQQAIDEGMQSLRCSAIGKVSEGITSMEEALKVIADY